MGIRTAFCCLLQLQLASSCTTLIAGRLATEDGSVMCTHSNDGGGTTDPRLVKIPAADHSDNAMRPVYWATEDYPRYVGKERGAPAYYPRNEKELPSKQIGEIPQVPHTYGYIEMTYGAINERQVGIGESTCSGVFGTTAVGHGGKALLSIDTLSQLAMERANSSRAAVLLMGSLAERYGFYGEGSFEGSAESLMVTDPNEGFIFHILPDDSGTSAVWAAQRVPDDHVAVVANAFVIREVDFSDPHNFLGSASVHEVAQRKGWWAPEQGKLDFTALYSDGEYAHKYYSGRRMWGAYRLMAPSLGLSPSYDEYRRSKPYPVTAPPDKKVAVADFAAVMRSYYEGTEFDQTVGLAAGPWGTPDHVAGTSAGGKVAGNWERTIGLFRTSDSHIVQSRGWLPDEVGGVLWWGPHAAPYTVYVPLAAGMKSLPDCTLGTPAVMERTSLFWGIRYLFNYAQLKRSAMIGHIVELQQKAHAASLRLQARVDRGMGPAGGSAVKITEEYTSNANAIRDSLFTLADELLFRYADGYVNEVDAHGTFHVTTTPYPDWWLNATDYSSGPPPVPTAVAGLAWPGLSAQA